MTNLYEKQVKSNIYNPINMEGAINASANNFNNLSNALNHTGNVLENEATKLYKREFENFALQVNNTLNDTMTNLYNNMPDKPAELEKEFLNSKNKLLEKINNDDLKLMAEKTYLTTQQIFLDRARKNNEIRINNETRNNIFKTINSNTEFFNLFYNKMYNDEIDEENLVNFNYNTESINNLLQTKTLGQHLLKNDLFTETDKKQITDLFNDLKISSAYRFFNEKYETDEEDFTNTIYYWERKPQEIQDKYNLTQEEYEKILRHTKKIKDNSDNLDNQGNVTLLASIETDIETRFNVLNRTTKKGKTDLINAKEYKNISYMADLNNRIEEAKALGLKDSKYQKYKEDIYNTIYNNFITKDEEEHIKYDSDWFTKKNINNNLINYLNKYLLPMDKIEKSQLYLEVATELQNQGINLTSENIISIEQSNKIIQNIIRRVYNIPDNENINNYLTNQKINKQIDFNNSIITSIPQYPPYEGGQSEGQGVLTKPDPLKLY